MDGSGKELKVEIVFLFGITNPQDQVKVLKKFMQVFRDRDSLQILKDAAGPRQVLEILKQLLGNFLIIENLSGKEEVMAIKIVVACGGGIFTTTVVTDKIIEILRKED